MSKERYEGEKHVIIPIQYSGRQLFLPQLQTYFSLLCTTLITNPCGGGTMLRLRDLQRLRHADQDMHGRSWWALHFLGGIGLLAAGYMLGKKRH